MKPGDLVRYKKKFEHRAVDETNGVLVGVVVKDVSDEYGFDEKWEMFEVLFNGKIANMFNYEVELVTE
jgi:hypothetical protein